MKKVFNMVAALSLGSILLACGSRTPGRAETRVVQFVKQRVTVGGVHDRNPVPPTVEQIARGRQQFENYCTSCHGADGRNAGVLFAEHMMPPVPHLDSPGVQAYTDGQLRWIIANGIAPSGMPAWKDVLGEEEMWQIVLLIRHLDQSGQKPDHRQ